MKSDYTYQLRFVKGHPFIMIEDKDTPGFASVTNNIHFILEDISEKENINVLEWHVIYKDSLGCWDGYIFKTGTFFSLNERHWLKAAIKIVKEYSYE